MKTYEAIYKPGSTKGVFGISLVEKPAMEGRFLALSEDETAIAFKTVNEDERILIGLVLEPNKPVYRKQDGEEFNVLFSEETVKELAFAFYKGSFHQNSSLEHADKIAGVTVVESWIIEDSKNDKSAALGLSHPKGSWMATMKVDSDEVWNNFVKTGKVTGFSVDALVSLKELNLKTNIEMSDKSSDSLAEKIANKVFAFFKTEQKIDLGSVKTSNKDVDIQFDGDTMEVGGSVWINAEDGTQVPLPAGEYPLEDAKVLVVVEEGKIAEVKEAAAPAEQQPAEQQPATMSAKESADTAETIANAIKSIMIKYSEDQEKKFTEFEQKLDKKLLEFGEQPATKPRIAVPDQAAPTTAKGRILAEIQNS